MLTLNIKSEPEMLAFGTSLAQLCHPPCVIYLQGDLGAGKTTLVRGFIKGLGYEGKVKSPTYTLVEPYELPDKTIFHFDLYRLIQPEQLDEIGIRDYYSPNAIVLIEWPEKGGEMLPRCDLYCYIDVVAQERIIRLEAMTPKGMAIIKSV